MSIIKNIIMHYSYAILKRWVLSDFLKIAKDCEFRTKDGKEFQSVGARVLNELAP